MSFNDLNKNPKNTDEIIFTDFNSVIYTLNIKAEENGEVVEKISKIFDIKSIKNINLESEKKKYRVKK